MQVETETSEKLCIHCTHAKPIRNGTGLECVCPEIFDMVWGNPIRGECGPRRTKDGLCGREGSMFNGTSTWKSWNKSTAGESPVPPPAQMEMPKAVPSPTKPKG